MHDHGTNGEAGGVRYIFLFAPNNSGTTVSCQYLAAQTGGYLPPYGYNEGQMAPAVRKVMRTRPWDAANRFDWGWIRGEWDALCRAAGKGLFIEGSPPNMVRVADIRAVFDGAADYLFFLSHPYMQIASCAYNYGAPDRQPIEAYARHWLIKAATIRRGMADNPDIALVTYEAFCADPGVLNRALGLPVRPVAPVEGKRADGNGRIRNLSARNIAFLRESEIDRIRAVLQTETGLVEGFGYDLPRGAECLRGISAQAGLVAEGLRRRVEWESRDAAG